jgi:predicted aconitase with swiveling domain
MICCSEGIAPAGFVFGKLNPVMVQGAVLARLAIAEGWNQDEIAKLRNGDAVRL